MDPIQLVLILGMVVVFYLFMIRPQQQQRKAINKMLAALKKGDKVLTTAGMRGEIVSIEDKSVTLRFHGDTRIDFDKSAITQVIEDKKEG